MEEGMYSHMLFRIVGNWISDHHFSYDQNAKLGKGAFGTVYRGKLLPYINNNNNNNNANNTNNNNININNNNINNDNNNNDKNNNDNNNINIINDNNNSKNNNINNENNIYNNNDNNRNESSMPSSSSSLLSLSSSLLSSSLSLSSLLIAVKCIDALSNPDENPFDIKCFRRECALLKFFFNIFII